MIKIEKFGGTEARLYEAVAPLVMDVAVIRQNHNYPFKTAEHFTWFVAFEGETVVGFMPVERRSTRATINNYYVAKGHEKALPAMIKAAVRALGDEPKLQAVAFVEDTEVFKKEHFEALQVWKLYVRMEHQAPEKKSD